MNPLLNFLPFNNLSDEQFALAINSIQSNFLLSNDSINDNNALSLIDEIKFDQFNFNASRRGASDSVTDSSVPSNPADAQNVSCLGLCGRDICPKSSA